MKILPKLSIASRTIVPWLLALTAINNVVLSQYIQKWQWLTTEDGEEKAFWRPLPLARYPLVEVINLEPIVVILEYNCYYMPAICQNARQYLISSIGRSRRWRTTFSYDMMSSRGGERREEQCPTKRNPTWRTYHSCPEVAGPGNLAQPPVMPGPWPFLDLETVSPFQSNEIRADRSVDPIARSGRYYSCDEFPPAPWVEGGNGTKGRNTSPEGDGDGGFTRCAPMAYNCPRINRQGAAGTLSEQNWQGLIHGHLRTKLWDLAYKNRDRQAKVTEVIMFQFRMANSAALKPARLLIVDGQDAAERVVNTVGRRAPGSKKKKLKLKEFLDWASSIRLDDPETRGLILEEVGIDVDEPEIRPPGIHELHGPDYFVNGSSPATDRTSLRNMTSLDLLPMKESATAGLPGRPSAPPNRPSSAGRTAKPWNITAGDVDVSLTKHKLHTPRQPTKGRINLIDIGTRYILSQIGANTTHAGGSRNNSASTKPSGKGRGQLRERSKTSFTPYAPLNKRDGPVQCGPNQPCLDESCCNTDGKCGYTAINCGAGSCISNCGAKAMCGINSADGAISCGLKLCCSYYGWCGTETVHCEDPEPQYGLTPCQEGYGSCSIKTSPSCGTGSGTAQGRRVGYYQGWNTRLRVCDKVYPSQINTRGLTHLFFSFVLFHPTTFQIMPMHEGDIPLYGEFTALKRNGLQTWIAIGGVSCHSHSPHIESNRNMRLHQLRAI